LIAWLILFLFFLFPFHFFSFFSLALDRESFHNHLGSLQDLMSTTERERVLNCMPLFGDLSTLEKHLLAASFSTETFQPGAAIIKENEIGQDFYIVVSGTLQASKDDQMVK
jgi:CRP-like cAMP-binding protein